MGRFSATPLLVSCRPHRPQDILDQVEGDAAATALVVAGEGKFFCNGIDMAWIDYQVTGKPREGGAMQMLSPETASHPVWADGERLLARLLTFPLPTAAAINGHWVAWGCMLGLAFDYRVMREDRGFMFVPAVDIGAIYSTGFTELMRAKVSRNVLRDMITFAKRYSASDLVEEGVVSAALPLEELVEGAKAEVRPWVGKGRKKDGSLSTMGGIKQKLCASRQQPSSNHLLATIFLHLLGIVAQQKARCLTFVMRLLCCLGR